MKADNRIIWNEAAKIGLVFGLFSSVCLVLKEGAALTGSTFLVQAAAIILWAVEFFGCILLMKKYMLDFRDKYDGVTITDIYRFGRRVGLFSGLILASVDAVLIMHIPEETVAGVVNELSAQLGGGSEAAVGAVVDRLPVYTFFFQWLYCFLYGCLLSSIMSRYIFLQDLRGGGPDNDAVDNQ